MYGARALFFAGYFMMLGYMIRKSELDKKIAARLHNGFLEMNRQSSRTFLDEAEARGIKVVLTSITPENSPVA
jgi:hypothetical protein